MAVVTLLLMLLLGPQPQFQNSPGSPLAGSTVCQGCHSDVYAKWSDSIHGKMIQRANRTSVVSKVEAAGGPASSKTWRDNSLYITEYGVEKRVDYTLGNRRMQHYLTTRPNGEIDVLRTTWDIKRQQWFDSKDIVRSAPANFVQQWNTSCLYCHVTQQEQDIKGFDPKTFEYKTTWVESSATCERCHGPRAEHAAAEASGNSTYVPAESETPFTRLVICGQCHWPKTVVATGFSTRKQYFDFYSPAFMHLDTDSVDPSWWVDGRPRRFSMEAAGFFLSGCFQSGKATCMSCHDPHWNRTDGNDALMKNADQYCLQCHAGLKAEAHTHHQAQSSGSSCVGCHMPQSVQGVKATMRDHSMSFPEPENTARYAVPNACNECHLDKTPDWAAGKVEQWYPSRSVRPRLRAAAFSLARKNDTRAVNSLVRLAGDLTENPEIRAAATGYLGHFSGEISEKMLITLTKDKQPMVRIEAARALAGVPTQASAAALAGMLDDPYRSVRIYAAGSLTSPLFPPLSFTAATQKSFDNAVSEFRHSLEIEGDHPGVQVRLGGLELSLGRYTDARDAYHRALRLNPAEPDAYVGLALVDLQTGNRVEAIREARHAVDVSSGKEVYRKFLEKIESK
jgi:predicted CXXCH cytochrome family protein